MKRLLCIFSLTLGLTTATSQIAGADASDRLFDTITAQANCASFLRYTFEKHDQVGFNSEDAAKKAANRHQFEAEATSEKLIKYLLKEKVEGNYLVTKTTDGFCFAGSCHKKIEYLEAVLVLGALRDGVHRVIQREFNCDLNKNFLFSCKGNRHDDTWDDRAVKLYKDSNCSLLLP